MLYLIFELCYPGLRTVLPLFMNLCYTYLMLHLNCHWCTLWPSYHIVLHPFVYGQGTLLLLNHVVFICILCSTCCPCMRESEPIWVACMIVHCSILVMYHVELASAMSTCVYTILSVLGCCVHDPSFVVLFL